MFDILIKGGHLIDGTGQAGRTGDIAIENGRIAAIGANISGPAKRVIEADGAIVTPGFIDVHSHYDGQATWDDKIDPSFSNGITTTVFGNCGVGFAPARPADRDLLISVMEGVEAIPGLVLNEGVPWKWETFPEYLDFLATRKYGVDVASLIPHAPLRVFVMGERAAKHEQATAEDIEQMCQLVREAMDAGALGLSTGRITDHIYFRGGTVNLVPGTFAEHEELLAITKAMAEGDRGMLQIILRGTVGGFSGKGITREERIAEHQLIEDVARATGRPVHYLLQQFDTDPEDWRMMLAETDRAVAEGLSIHPHIASRGFGSLATLAGYHNFMVRPAYLEIAHLPVKERAARMREPDVRARILADENLPVAECPDPMDWGFANLLDRLADGGYLLDRDNPDYEPCVDQQIGALSVKTGKPVQEIIYDHLTSGEGDGIIAQMFFNYAQGNSDHTYDLIRNPSTMLSLGDGGAHMRVISDASMLAYALTYWSRDRKRGPRLPIEQVVAKITGHNARIFGFEDRGILAPGKRADINVIDFDAMHVKYPTIVQDLPAGGVRLNQKTSGFIATLLNGVVTRERDTDTGARPGRLVRGAQPN